MVRLILIIGFVVSFSAGLVVGLRMSPPVAGAPTTMQANRRAGLLTSELKLSVEQQEQLKKIWSETARRGGREQDDRRRQIRKERDESIASLIKTEEKEKYDQVMKTYAEKMAAMEMEWHKSYENAVERTKQILSSDQRRKYEELLARQVAERAARDQNRRADDHATSRPASEK